MTDTIQETKPLRYGLHSFRCPTCNRRAHTVSEVKFDDDVLIDLSCGHQTVKTALSGAGELVSLDGKTLRDYQITSVEFSEKAGGNVVILHEMGLGKTPISIALVKRNFDTMCPALVLCKSKLKEQWAHEIIRWAGPEFVPQLIENGREKPLAGFRFYVISLDLLRNIRGLFSDVKFKTVIIDEVQLIKNDDAKRTVAVRELAREAEFKIGLSGTYIKNNASEAFPILNIVRPDKFPTRDGFNRMWVRSSFDGYRSVKGGLRNPQRFHEYTEDFILRYTREEVAPDLPKVDRGFLYVDFEDPEMRKAYDKAFGEFEEMYKEFLGKEKHSLSDYSNLLAYISRMRHITGVAKVQSIVDYTTQFLLETERKLAIFIHHRLVGNTLNQELSSWCRDGGYDTPLLLTADSNAFSIAEQFNRDPKKRILIASTLAGGEGLNLQYACNDVIVGERQWNSANEEQVESRFTRPDSIALGGYVHATYPVAVGTIDEWMSELCEKKRAIVAQVQDGIEVEFSETKYATELANLLMSKGKPKWKLPK